MTRGSPLPTRSRHRCFHAVVLSALVTTGSLLGPRAAAQHSHINAGALDTVAGSRLFFANASQFAAESGHLIHLAFQQSPQYGPIYFGGSDVTFTSLPATLDNGGPTRFAARLGTHVEAVFETLEGPTGGALSFWDSFDGFFDATEITSSITVGTTDGNSRFVLSENDGSAEADPYGHIHGRKFSVNLPGLYTLGVRLVDTSGNGPNGGPQHAPSELTYFLFQAGISLARLTPGPDGVTVSFGSDSGWTYWVEATSTLEIAASWEAIAGPFTGTGKLMSTDPLPPTGSPRFFRLRAAAPAGG